MQSRPDMRKISLLGATGSIGRSTLDVLRRHQGEFSLCAAACGSNAEAMLAIAREFRLPLCAVADQAAASKLEKALREEGIKTEVLSGQEGVCQCARAPGRDGITVCAVVGAAGLPGALAAVREGCTVALANKEALVMSGKLFFDEAKAHGARVLPVDSEHSAIFQCLPAKCQDSMGFCDLRAAGVLKILLTGSGPFVRLAFLVPGQSDYKPHSAVTTQLLPGLQGLLKGQALVPEPVVYLRQDIVAVPLLPGPKPDIRILPVKVCRNVPLGTYPEHLPPVVSLHCVIYPLHHGRDVVPPPLGKVTAAGPFKGLPVKGLLCGGIEVVVNVDTVHIVIFQYLRDSLRYQLPDLTVSRVKVPPVPNQLCIWELRVRGPLLRDVGIRHVLHLLTGLEPQRVHPGMDGKSLFMGLLSHYGKGVIVPVKEGSRRKQLRPVIGVAGGPCVEVYRVHSLRCGI